jgi:hypothetical protein
MEGHRQCSAAQATFIKKIREEIDAGVCKFMNPSNDVPMPAPAIASGEKMGFDLYYESERGGAVVEGYPLVDGDTSLDEDYVPEDEEGVAAAAADDNDEEYLDLEDPV